MSLSTEAAGAPHARANLAFNLAGLTLLLLLLAIGAAYLIDRSARAGTHNAPSLGDTDPVVQTIGSRELSIPANWFRYGEQIKGGFASQVDLEFRLDLVPGAAPVPVEVSLMPRSRARASSALLDRVYLHQFDMGIVEGVPGLVGKPLAAKEGYFGETVWYDPLSPSPFVAKCAKAVDAAQPDRCLRTIHLQSGLAAVLSFDATALSAWQHIDGELASWLGQIGAL